MLYIGNIPRDTATTQLEAFLTQIYKVDNLSLNDKHVRNIGSDSLFGFFETANPTAFLPPKKFQFRGSSLIFMMKRQRNIYYDEVLTPVQEEVSFSYHQCCQQLLLEMYQGALNHKPLQAVNYQESLLDLLSMKPKKMSEVKSEARVEVIVNKGQKRRAFIPSALKGVK